MVSDNGWLAAVQPCVGFADWLFGGMDSKPLFDEFLYLSFNFSTTSSMLAIPKRESEIFAFRLSFKFGMLQQGDYLGTRGYLLTCASLLLLLKNF